MRFPGPPQRYRSLSPEEPERVLNKFLELVKCYTELETSL